MDRNFHLYNGPLQCNCRQTVVPPAEYECVCNASASNGVGRSVPLRSDIKGTELPPANILIPLERQLIARYNFAADSFYIVKLGSRLPVRYCRNCPKDDKFRYLIPILRKLEAA